MNKILDNIDTGTITFENYIISIVIDTNGEIWFNAIDTASALGYKDIKKTIRRQIDDDDKNQLKFINHKMIKDDHPNAIYLSEAGLYTLILQSKQPKAKKFKYWVTHDVLPNIRKYDVYKLKKDHENEMIEIGKKINYLVKENTELKNHIKKEKYPEGELVYAIDYSTEEEEIYRIGMTKNLEERKKLYNTHTLYNRRVAHKRFTKCPLQFETCVLSLLYNFRFSDDKSFFKCNLDEVKKAFRLCKNSIKCIEQRLNKNQNIQECQPEKINKNIKGGLSSLVDQLIKEELNKYKMIEIKKNMLNDILSKINN